MFKGIFYTKKKGETIMAELESLDIRIDSTTASASKKIDDLIAKVGGLETAFTRIGNLNTTNLSNQLRVLGTSLQTFKQGGLTGREFSTIASGLQKIASVDSNGLRNTASAIQQVGSAIQSMNNASANSGGISAFARSISRIVPLANASGNIATLGVSLRTFVNDLNSVPQTTFDATSLTASINAISRLGGKNSRSATTTIPLLTHAMKNFVIEMNKVGDLQSGSQNLHSLANAISILGRKTSEKAITNIPQLAKSLNEMMVVLSKSPRVSDNLINMTNALAKLSANGVKATGTVNGLTKSYRIFGNHTRSLNKHSRGLASTIGMLYARFWVLFRAFRLLGSAVKYASDLIEVQNVIDNTFGVSTTKAINSNADAIQHMSKNTISWFGMSELTTKTIAGRYMAMGSAMGLANRQSDGLSKHLSSLMGDMGKVTNKASEMALNITALAGDMASFYNVDANEMSEKLASGIYSGQVRALRAYGLDLTMATLQEYAMSRGITENVKNMTQAEKTLLRYNYVMERTQNVQGDFVRTQGTWANQTRMLKQNLQQLGSVIGDVMIHALKGFVTWTNKALLSLTGFAVEVANALGKIFGWTIETSGGSTGLDDLTDDTEDIADGFGDATSKAKEFKNVLQGFDKLNLITTPSDSGSGKGSGVGGGGSQLSDWNIKKTDGSLMKYYESDIENLEQLGDFIQDKLVKAMERIDWDKVYAKGKGFGKGLADFLNGLITPNLFGTLGTTIANSINTAIYTATSFNDTFRWANLGESLGTGLNKFLGGIDWDSAISLNKNFGVNLATSINNFLKTTDFTIVGKTVADAIVFATSGAFGLVSTFDFSTLGTKIADSINGWSTEMNKLRPDPKTGKMISGWQQLALTFTRLVDGLADAIYNALADMDWGEILKGAFEGFVELLKSPGAWTLLLGAKGLSALKSFGASAGAEISSTLSSSISSKLTLSLSVAGISYALGDSAVNDLSSGKTTTGIAKSIASVLGWGVSGASIGGGWGFLIGATIGLVINGIDYMVSNDIPKKTANMIDEMLDSAMAQYKQGKESAKFGTEIASILVASLTKGLSDGDSLGKAISKAFGNGFSFASTTIGQKFSNLIGGLFGSDAQKKADTVMSKLKSHLTNGWNNFWLRLGVKRADSETIKKVVNGIKSVTNSTWANKKVKIGVERAPKSTIQSVIDKIKQQIGSIEVDVKPKSTSSFVKLLAQLGNVIFKKADGGVFNNGSWHPIPQYASGGVPDMGQMFIARESGPELVGTLGGHSAVMNNDQIVASVSNGVYQAVKSALGNGQNVTVNVTLQGDADGLFTVVQNKNNQYKKINGHSAF